MTEFPHKLVWNKTSDNEWQAGGMRHGFCIEETSPGNFTLAERFGDGEFWVLCTKGLLAEAQQFAEGRKGKS